MCGRCGLKQALRRAALLVLVGVGGLGPAAAAAALPSPPADASLWQLEPWPHALGTVGLLTVVGLAQVVVAPSLAPMLTCQHAPGAGVCSPDGLLGPDRWGLKLSSARWRTTSDLGQALSVLGPLSAALWEHGVASRPARWAEAGRDTLVLLRAVAVANVAATVLKFAVRRPRPSLYQLPGRNAQQNLSFPSGHATTAAAGVTAYASTFWARHPQGRWRYVVAGAGALVAGVTAVGRVAGGKHFVSDVVGGLALGASVGLLLPPLERRRQLWLLPTAEATEAAGPAIGLSLRWQHR